MGIRTAPRRSDAPDTVPTPPAAIHPTIIAENLLLSAVPLCLEHVLNYLDVEPSYSVSDRNNSDYETQDNTKCDPHFGRLKQIPDSGTDQRRTQVSTLTKNWR